LPEVKYDAVIFDLLTALLNSWTLWDDVAGNVRIRSFNTRCKIRLSFLASAEGDCRLDGPTIGKSTKSSLHGPDPEIFCRTKP
jgi:hypothetical protein